MFIEQSKAKIRFARLVFLVLGVMPVLVLTWWAIKRNSLEHLASFRREIEQQLGEPLGIQKIEHVRPGVVRLWGCEVLSPRGDVLVRLPEIEVETSATEMRMTIPSMECGADVMSVMASLGKAWLFEPVRFSRSWIIDVHAFRWMRMDSDGTLPTEDSTRISYEPFPLRIECVAAGGSRAIRFHRVSSNSDEVRVIATVEDGMELHVHGTVETPVPWHVLKVCVPDLAEVIRLGPTALATGVLSGHYEHGSWSAEMTGRVEGVQMEELSTWSHDLEGVATLQIERLQWHKGRLKSLAATVAAAHGILSQSLLGDLVTAFGCRAGPAFHALDGKQRRVFDDLNIDVFIDENGLRLKSEGASDGVLVRCQGLSLLQEPLEVVPLDRLSWLLRPAGGVLEVSHPLSSSWLLQVLPMAVGASRDRENTATRPLVNDQE